VGLFLAILELIKAQLIWAEQPQANEGIYLRALTEVPAEEAVRKAIMTAEAEAAAIQTSESTAEPQPQTAQDRQLSIPISELPADNKKRSADELEPLSGETSEQPK
jgi:hypothetical protein